VTVESSHVILPRIGDRSGAVRYAELSRDPVIEPEVYKKRKYASYESEPEMAKRISLDVDENNLVSGTLLCTF
jgi:hypothetical protein